MGRIQSAWNALTGNLDRQYQALGIVRARRVEPGWVIRTAGQGRGRRWLVRNTRGPAGMHGLVQIEAKLVEVHGVRSRARLRAMGVDPDAIEEIYLEDEALVVIEHLDWPESEDEPG
jgi:hypothetical protein